MNSTNETGMYMIQSCRHEPSMINDYCSKVKYYYDSQTKPARYSSPV